MTWVEIGKLGGSGGGVPLPPAGATDYVYGVDPLGVPGWVPRDRLIGATLWPAGDYTSPSNSQIGTSGFYAVQLRDADEHGMVFFDPTNPDRIIIPADGWYEFAFGVSMDYAGTGIYRARMFKNGDPIVEDLTGRASFPMTVQTWAGSIDLSGTTGPVWMRAGEYMQLGTGVQSTNGTFYGASNNRVLGVARSSTFRIKKVR